MGVTGLWRLIEPSGRPVPLETLENKILAVDVSIWLHQSIKGFQDTQGAPLPNAHLLGVYHRVCKLLYYKIKPIFVFDGGVPVLKRETISKRSQLKAKKLNEADQIQKQLLSTLLKHSAVNQVLSERAKAELLNKASVPITTKQTEDIYKLPPAAELDSSFSEDDISSSTKQWDLHSIDEKSPHFKSLPVDIKHEILTELKETRKQNSWGRLHEIPKQSGEFSGYQMKRLLKRYSVQVTLEEVEKEMGGCSMSLAELETLLNDQGVVTSNDSVGKRIASNEHKKYVLIKDVKKAIKEAKQHELALKRKEAEDQKTQDATKLEDEEKILRSVAKVGEQKLEVQGSKDLGVSSEVDLEASSQADLEYEDDLKQAIQLSLQEVPSTSTASMSLNLSFLNDDVEESDESEKESYDLTTAKNYMKEYSGLTSGAIDKIINENASIPKNKSVNGKFLKSSNSKTVSHKNIATEPLVQKENISSGTTTKAIESDIPVVAVVEETSLDMEIKEDAVLKIDIVPSETEVSSVTTTEAEVPIEIMSDSNSDSDDDFLEVSESNKKVNTEKGLEILINHEEPLEDDIFSDIFTDENVSSKVSKPVNLQKLKVSKPNIDEAEQTKSAIVVSSEPQLVKENIADLTTVSETGQTEETSDVLKNSNKSPDRGVAEEILKKPDFEKPETVITTKDLLDMEDNLRKETEELVSGKNSTERLANSLSDQIHQETQELLQLFGIPYIVAPMEAEAQCAFLEYIGLTNGTITDDSDIWLFGGSTVYKNFFDQRKLVMEFRSENILQHFKLSREQMILLALLVGSDYTTGIQGIGPVTALEVLAAFPSPAIENSAQHMVYGLEKFRKWLESEAKPLGLGRVTLRNKLKNVRFVESFPSVQVVQAYLKPTVNESKDPFSWAKPDVHRLVEFARKKFGWPHAKSEKILDPVMKQVNEIRMQKSIKDYFEAKHKLNSEEAERKMSKRVKTAIGRIGNPAQEEVVEHKKRVPGKRKRKAEVPSADIVKESAGLSSDEDVQVLKQTSVQSKSKLRQIIRNVKEEIVKVEKIQKKPRTIQEIHKKEVIPQKERDKIGVIRAKMKAIDTFRKSKLGSDTHAKRKKAAPRKLKEDAELSESSSSD